MTDDSNVLPFPQPPAGEPTQPPPGPSLSGFVPTPPDMASLRDMTLDAAIRAHRLAVAVEGRDILAHTYSCGQRDAYAMALVTSYHPPGIPDPATATKLVEALQAGSTDRWVLFSIASSSGV